MKTIELKWAIEVPDKVGEGEVLEELIGMCEKRGWMVLNRELEWWMREDGELFRDFLFALVNKGSATVRSGDGKVRIGAMLEVSDEFNKGNGDYTLYPGPIDGFLSKKGGWVVIPDKRVVSDFPNKLARLIRELNGEK